MKKILVIVITTLIIILFIFGVNYITKRTIDNKNYESENIYTNIENENINDLEENYYLHESNLEVPSQEKCYAAQERALKDLTSTDKKKIQENIRIIHNNFERQLVDSVRLIKDSNSPYWEDFTTYGVFTDPYTGIKVDNGGRFLYILDSIEKIKQIVKDKNTKEDFQNAYNILKEGMTEHKLSKCFEAHKIIHDYDYWIINNPVYLEYAPVDWGGTTTYFGKTSIIK